MEFKLIQVSKRGHWSQITKCNCQNIIIWTLFIRWQWYNYIKPLIPYNSPGTQWLTPWPLEKVFFISEKLFRVNVMIFSMDITENVLRFACEDVIGGKSALGKVMAWCRQPLPLPMLTLIHTIKPQWVKSHCHPHIYWQSSNKQGTIRDRA